MVIQARHLRWQELRNRIKCLLTLTPNSMETQEALCKSWFPLLCYQEHSCYYYWFYYLFISHFLSSHFGLCRGKAA